MERALRFEPTRAQATLATVATRLNVRWSFQVTRGQMAAQVSEAATETDLIADLLGQRAGRNGTYRRRDGDGDAGRALSVAHVAACRYPSAFVVIYDGSPASVRALRLAGQLAEAEGKGVTVLLVAAEPSKARQLRIEVDAVLAEANVIPQYPALPHPDVAAIARAVRAASAGTLVMAAESPVFNGEVRRRLLEKLEIAALLTR